MLLLLTTNTYNAYNDWGGPNLYTGGIRVSFRRPFASGLLKKPRPEVRYPNVDDVDDPEHERSARGPSSIGSRPGRALRAGITGNARSSDGRSGKGMRLTWR